MPASRVALLTIDDRDLASQALASIERHAQNLEPVVAVHVDDAGHELGFCGAIREAWARLRAVNAEQPFDYVLHWEADFTAVAGFDVARMAAILDAYPDIAQVVLKRGPHGREEEAAGGFMELWPLAYESHLGWDDEPDSVTPWFWTRHSLFYSTNPALCRRALLDVFEWPEAPACEAQFTRTLLAEGFAFAYLGARDDPPLVHHHGIRTGRGY